MSAPIRILSTKKLKPNQRQFLLNAGFSLIEADFIAVRPKEFTFADIRENLIFTSQNAVKAVAGHAEVQQIRRNPVFCVGSRTFGLLDEVGFTVVESAEDAAGLSKIIIGDYASERFTFFSGNLRRNELPMALEAAKIQINEIEVYETALTPVKMASEYDGILFFSPSAVRSFLSENAIGDQPIFCIGQTAESEVRSSNPSAYTIVPRQHTIESTIAKCIDYFKRPGRVQNL